MQNSMPILLSDAILPEMFVTFIYKVYNEKYLKNSDKRSLPVREKCISSQPILKMTI